MTLKNSSNSNSIAPIHGSGSVQVTESNGGLTRIPGYVIETTGSVSGSEEIDLREYVRRILRHKLIVLIVTLLLMIAPAYYILNLPRVFQAEARIQVDEETDIKEDGMRPTTTTFDNRSYFNTQLMLLKNSQLIRNVIRQKGLETNKAFLDKRFIDPGDIPSGVGSNRGPGKAQEGPAADPAFKEIGKEFDAERLNPIVEAIQGSLDVQPVLQSKQTVKDTRLISVKFVHPDPSVAKLVANALSDELVAHNLKYKTESNSTEREYLSNNIEELKSQIRQSENRILEFGRQHQLPSEDGNQNTVVERLVGLNRQLLEAENERKIAEARHKASIAPGATAALAESGEKEISDIEAKLDDLRRTRAQLLVEVTEKHPEALAIDKQIAVLENAAKRKRNEVADRFKTSLNVNLSQAIARENSIRASYDRQWRKMLDQNGAAINYRIVQQELETNRKLLDEMQTREKESEMLSAKTPNNIRVVEYALTPTDPVDQKQLIFFCIAFFGSFSIGIAAALFRDYFSDSGQPADEITRSWSLPALVSIPELGGGEVEQDREFRYTQPSEMLEKVESQSAALTKSVLPSINGDSLSILARAIQKHQTVLQLSADACDAKSLLITSGSGAGQTRTAINIAKNLAESGASVLIVDADFYDPKIHKSFGKSFTPGLSDLLTGDFFKKNMRDSIEQVSENLHFLPSGQIPYKCSDRLGSDRMRELMMSLEANFDFVIINSPPVLFYADSSIMATNVNRVLLVASESRDWLDELEQIRVFLKRAGANILGVVLGTAEQPAAVKTAE